MNDTSSPIVTSTRQGDVAVITMDDGKANAISYEMMEALNTALDEAEGSAALALVGRPGKFCAGFDLSVVQKGPAAAIPLMDHGARLALRLFEWPAPVVFGVTGHALAMGAVLLACSDLRVGCDGAFKIGLNEVAIGLAMPTFASELVRTRLATRHFHRAVQLAHISEPTEAVSVGWLDELVPAEEVDATTVARATELAATLEPRAFEATRRALRSPLADQLRGTLLPDVGS